MSTPANAASPPKPKPRAKLPGPPYLDLDPPPASQPSPERLAALYAFTRTQRESNPDGYAANVKWWGNVLAGTLAQGYLQSQAPSGKDKVKVSGDVLVLNVTEGMLDKLANGGQRPRGMGGVIDCLTTTTTLLPLPKYESASTPIDAPPSLASRLVGAGWSVLGRISPFSGDASEEQLWKYAVRAGKYVHLPNVRASAQTWAAYMVDHPPIDYTDSLYSRAGFAREFSKVAALGEAALSESDVNVLLRWLERDAGKIVVEGDIIKITNTASPITEADRGAVAVADALEQVENQITAAEKEAEACHIKARKQIAAGQRTSAAAYLRSKKQLDELVGKRVAAGEQLRSVHRALNQAKGDTEIMSAYEASTSALASALSDPRLSPDRIAATTDALADALADQREIDDAVRLGSQLATGTPAEEDDDLARELEAMVLDEKERLERQERERVKAEAEAKVLAAEAAKEKAERERAEKERAEKERAEREKQAAEAKAKAEAAAAAAPRLSNAELAAADWARRHEEAQAREAAEKARFEAERLAREERMMPAE